MLCRKVRLQRSTKACKGLQRSTNVYKMIICVKKQTVHKDLRSGRKFFVYVTFQKIFADELNIEADIRTERDGRKKEEKQRMEEKSRSERKKERKNHIKKQKNAEKKEF